MTPTDASRSGRPTSPMKNVSPVRTPYGSASSTVLTDDDADRLRRVARGRPDLQRHLARAPSRVAVGERRRSGTRPIGGARRSRSSAPVALGQHPRAVPSYERGEASTAAPRRRRRGCRGSPRPAPRPPRWLSPGMTWQLGIGQAVHHVDAVLEGDDVVGVAVPPLHRHLHVAELEAPVAGEQQHVGERARSAACGCR